MRCCRKAGGILLKKTERKNKPVSPIYAVAVVWIVCSAIAPIYTVGRFFFTALLSFVVYCAVRVLATKRQQERDRKQAEVASAQAKTERETKPKPKQAEPPKPKYPPEVQAIVDEGERAHGELERLYASIPDLAIKRKVREIIDVSDKIVADAVTDPSDVPQIKKFLDYYLPTTIKLLNAYDHMGAQGIEGENISGTMERIETMLDSSIAAFKKLLDNLFQDQAIDIETDIAVMNTLLRREGLSDEAGL